MSNAPQSRRWRLHDMYGNTGASASYKLPCRVSERVAIAHTDGSWALWGYPAPQGVPIECGQSDGQCHSDKLRNAKVEARLALDALADRISQGYFPETLSQ